MTMGVTTTAIIREDDVLAADSEHGIGGASAYRWLIDSGAIHSMTPYRSNYVTFTRGTLNITDANVETTIAERYSDILVDLLNQNSEPEPFLLKDVWYVPERDCNLLSVPQLLSQGIVTVFVAQGGALLKGRNTIPSINISERKFWLRTTNETSIAHQKSLAVATSSPHSPQKARNCH